MLVWQQPVLLPINSCLLVARSVIDRRQRRRPTRRPAWAVAPSLPCNGVGCRWVGSEEEREVFVALLACSLDGFLRRREEEPFIGEGVGGGRKARATPRGGLVWTTTTTRVRDSTKKILWWVVCLIWVGAPITGPY